MSKQIIIVSVTSFFIGALLVASIMLGYVVTNMSKQIAANTNSINQIVDFLNKSTAKK